MNNRGELDTYWKVFFTILAIALLVFSILGLTNASKIFSFDNGLTIENLTFLSKSNITRYVNISLHSNITSSYINLSGFTASNTTSVYSMEDTYVDENDPNNHPSQSNNFANRTYFRVYGLNGNNKESYVKFNLSGLPDNVSISQAIFNVYKKVYSFAGRRLYLYNISNNTWMENAVTWNTQPIADSNYITYFDTDGSSGWYTLDVTNLISEEYAVRATDNNVSLAIKRNDSDNVNTQEFNSREIGIAGSPYINITYLSYINDSWLDIGNDAINEWSYTGQFTQTNNRTTDLSSAFNVALNNGSCDCQGCIRDSSNCSIPLIFHSDTIGKLQISDINIQYKSVPVSNLSAPKNNTVVSSPYNFVCNSSDLANLQNVTIYLWNLSNDKQYNRTSVDISGISNSTTFAIYFNQTEDFKWNCKVCNNESYCDWDENYTVRGDIDNPVINLNYPTHEQWINISTNINFNFTANHPTENLDTCQFWSNSTGIWHLNQTKTGLTKGIVNTFKQNLTDGNYNWTVWCNVTTTGNSAFSQDGNFTVNIDTLYPQINYSTVNNSQVSGLATTINFNISDNHSNSCSFTLRDSSGAVHNYAERTTLPCISTTRSISVLAYGTYAFYLYANDLAGNENVSSITFNANAPGSTGGGGGGGETLVAVVAIIQPNVTVYSEVQRAILYARINEYCVNYSISRTTCSISTKISSLISKLDSQNVQINTSVLNEFIKYFNQKKFETVKVSESSQRDYNLVVSTISIVQQAFTLNPSAIDTPWLILSDTYSVKVLSSKTLKSCKVQDGIGLSCQVTDSSATVTYKLHVYPPEFNFKLITGVIMYTDVNDNVVFQNVGFRALTIQGLLFFVIPGAGVIFVIFKFRKNIGNYLKNMKKKLF